MRSSPFRKFAPLAAVAGVQLLIILLVPSVAKTAGADQLLGAGVGGVAGSGAGGVGAPTAGGAGSVPLAGAAAGSGVSGGPTGAGSVSGGSLAAGGVGPSGARPGAAVAPAASTPQVKKQLGDTSHCVGGRQFDPALDYFAPPCVPGQPGGPYPADNGGATGPGVTAKSIEIVNYIPDFGSAVDTILKAQGLYYNADSAKVFNAAFQRFVNAKYQLYGRQVKIDTFQGTCSTGPPDPQCLIGEMDKLVATYHPYAVVFSDTLCSECYSELARLKVVSTGGAGFSDAFRNANAPYIYDQGMSSTRVEDQFVDFWCNQMTSQGGSGRVASFAGGENPAQDFRTKPRVLGIIATNDQDIQRTVTDVLIPHLKKQCGENVTHTYFYANDISTAQQQSSAATARMNDSHPATSVLCLCDPVAPQFIYGANSQNNYWPESLVASNQALDTDNSAQTFVDNNGQTTLSCPTPQRGCAFDGALGIGAFQADVTPAQLAGTKVYAAGGGTGSPVAAITLQIFWDNYSMLGSLIQNTGPVLTAARMQAAAPSLGMRGGGTTGHALRGFQPGQWTWTRDVRVLYFNKHKPSPYNGKNGSWVQIEGGRKNFGQFARLSSPPAPAADKR
jgi:hypothetical protein